MLVLKFDVVPSQVKEDTQPGEWPDALVRRLAHEKALVVQRSYPAAIILGADTVVTCDEHILGKPGSASEARDMLWKLSGRTHQVMTGVCLLHGQTCRVDHSVTDVTFNPMTEQEIESYVRSGEPLDKAGAYGIQGIGARFIDRIDGCYFNVVGLPISLLYKMIRSIGHQPL